MPTCPSPKLVSDSKRLIFRYVDGKVSPHAQDGFQHITIHRSHPRRPQTVGIGECRFAAAVGHPQKGPAAAETSLSRSAVLDIPDEDLETMENGARYRTTRYRCELAAASIQAVLVEFVPKEGIGTSAGLCRSPKAGSGHVGRERDVGRATNSW